MSEQVIYTGKVCDTCSSKQLLHICDNCYRSRCTYCNDYSVLFQLNSLETLCEQCTTRVNCHGCGISISKRPSLREFRDHPYCGGCRIYEDED